eukprot:232747-Rhodomonas_salina.1
MCIRDSVRRAGRLRAEEELAQANNNDDDDDDDDDDGDDGQNRREDGRRNGGGLSSGAPLAAERLRSVRAFEKLRSDVYAALVGAQRLEAARERREERRRRKAEHRALRGRGRSVDRRDPRLDQTASVDRPTPSRDWRGPRGDDGYRAVARRAPSWEDGYRRGPSDGERYRSEGPRSSEERDGDRSRD